VRTYKLLIAGSREITDYEFIAARLDYLTAHITADEDVRIEVVEGEAPGVDRLARRWGEERGYAVKPFPADWNGLGKKAGFVRNKQMVEYGPDGAILFWDGVSKGTNDTLNLVIEAGIEYRVVRPDNSL
jgi:hypothetical protein